MASSEGVTFRWEAFNRWCDEYADRHGGMKPKVEDVRKWHRENAEKVWPDSAFRPSVFLAVSHNKGRRVRGHKTCEYYKRYRAGKAAEQQLAARLQPAALSGRRILAVTAAARRLNTGGAGKRSPLDDDSGEEADAHDYEPSEKRRRVHSVGRSHLCSGTRARRGASSEDFSEEPSWASGAGSSDDDSGAAAAASLGPGQHRGRAPPGLRPQLHSGVHITFVRRDAEGRPIQVQTQPPGYMHGGELPLFEGPQNANGAATAAGSAGGRHRLHAMGSGEHGAEDANGTEPTLSQRQRRRPQPQHWTPYVQDGEECEEDDSGEAAGPRQPRRWQGGSVVQDADGEWAWNGGWHPGVAPPGCRATRSRPAGGQPAAPSCTGYMETPIGAVPVYHIARAGGGGGRGAAAAAARRVGSSARPNGAAGPGPAAGAVGAAAVKDPLDLLAQLACEALASPRPPAAGDAAADRTAPQARVAEEPALAASPAGAGPAGGSEGACERAAEGCGPQLAPGCPAHERAAVKQEPQPERPPEAGAGGGHAVTAVAPAGETHAASSAPEAGGSVLSPSCPGAACSATGPAAAGSPNCAQAHPAPDPNAAAPPAEATCAAPLPLCSSPAMAATASDDSAPAAPAPALPAPTPGCALGGGPAVSHASALVPPTCAPAALPPAEPVAAAAPAAPIAPIAPAPASDGLGASGAPAPPAGSQGVDAGVACLGSLAANAAAANMAAALLLGQQHQQVPQPQLGGGGGGGVGPAAPLALPLLQGLPGVLPAPPLPQVPLPPQLPQLPPMPWPAMGPAGVGALLAAPPGLATGAAPPPPPPLFSDPSGQFLRLLQMQMVAAAGRPEALALPLPLPGPLLPGLSGEQLLAGLPPAAAAAVHGTCAPPAAPPLAMEVGLVGAAPSPHSMLAMPLSLALPQSR